MDWDCVLNPGGCVVEWALGVGQDTVMGQWTDFLWKGVGQTLIVIGTLWIKVPTPSLTATYSPVTWINGVLGYLTAGVFVGSLIVSGTIMAWRSRKESLREIGEGMVLFVVVNAGGTLILQVLIELGDSASNHFLASASGNPQTFAKNMTGLVFNTPNTATNMAILMFVGIVAIFANLVQIVLMFARSGLLMLLAGFLPMMAALAVSPAGKGWLKKGVGWSLAFVLYKPVAALIYAVAIQMMSSFTVSGGVYHPLVGAASTGSGDAAMAIIMAGSLMVVSVFALPSLIAFLVPSTSVLAGAGSGSGLASVGMAASGAVSVSGAVRGMSGAKAGVAASSASPPTAAVAAAGAGISAARSAGEKVLSSAGIHGTQGQSGSDGNNGTGLAGTTGAHGSSGVNGGAGSAAAQGANGSSGANGAAGIAGAHGSAGATGANGGNGSSGARGATGSNGAQGAAGASAQNAGAPVAATPTQSAVQTIPARGYSA